MSDTTALTKLGAKETKYKFTKPDKKIFETFQNQHPDVFYMAPFECFEFTSLCPKTGQPDYAKIHINYIPREKCIESKSMKLYLNTFRNSGEFMEDIANRIMKDIRTVIDPWYVEVYADFNSRGGISLRPFSNSYNKLLAEDIKRDYIDRLLNRFSQVK